MCFFMQNIFIKKKKNCPDSLIYYTTHLMIASSFKFIRQNELQFLFFQRAASERCSVKVIYKSVPTIHLLVSRVKIFEQYETNSEMNGNCRCLILVPRELIQKTSGHLFESRAYSWETLICSLFIPACKNIRIIRLFIVLVYNN